MNKMILMVSTIFFIFTTLLKAYDGGSGVPALMMDSYGARSMALADSFVGLADDINTISVNPAGLNTLHSMEGSIMYMIYPEDMSLSYLAFGAPLPDSAHNGYIAGSVTLFSSGNFDQYDSTGNLTGKSLSASDFVLNLAYANNPLKFFNIQQNLNAGIDLKLISSKLVDDRAAAFAFDLGFLYKMDFYSFGEKGLKDNLGIGFAMQNLGTSIKYGVEDTSLPRNFKLGFGYTGYKIDQHSLTLCFDLNFPNDSSTISSIGVEYSFLNQLFARVGYKISGPAEQNFSFGIGANYTLFNKLIKFDYALIPLADLGTSHTFTLGIKF